MRGRDDDWRLIYKGAMSLPFRDMVWFAGKVRCTSDFGTWTIENGVLVDPELPSSVRACSGNLAVGDGVMPLAGFYGASVFDGTTWTPFGPP